MKKPKYPPKEPMKLGFWKILFSWLFRKKKGLKIYIVCDCNDVFIEPKDKFHIRANPVKKEKNNG